MVKRAPIRPIVTDDVKTNKALDEIRDGIPDLGVIDGLRLIENVQLTAGTTKVIPHGLGRKLRGWIVVRINLGANNGYLYDLQNSSTSHAPEKYLYLRAEGYSPKISLLVF